MLYPLSGRGLTRGDGFFFELGEKNSIPLELLEKFSL
jgi:hypothetical protein